MNAAEIVRRKIELKRQAARIMRAEIQDLQFQAVLLRYRAFLAGRIGDRFDLDLSGKLDLVQALIDSGRLSSLSGEGAPITDPGPALHRGEQYEPFGRSGQVA